MSAATWDYVVVSMHPRGNRWQVVRRVGDVATYAPMEAPIAKPDMARDEAQRMFPGLTVVMPGDPIPGISSTTVTYAERAEFTTPIVDELKRIAHRLQQGAISDESAAQKLAAIAARLTGAQQ